MNCPCGSGKKYKNCCQRYHDGVLPENALKLMKARYSAYAENRLQFLYDTLHPDLCKESFEEFTKGVRRDVVYERLVVHDFKDGERFAEVLFTAYLKIRGKDGTFTEKSEFEKVGGKWLYKSGRVMPGGLI